MGLLIKNVLRLAALSTAFLPLACLIHKPNDKLPPEPFDSTWSDTVFVPGAVVETSLVDEATLFQKILKWDTVFSAGQEDSSLAVEDTLQQTFIITTTRKGQKKTHRLTVQHKVDGSSDTLRAVDSSEITDEQKESLVIKKKTPRKSPEMTEVKAIDTTLVDSSEKRVVETGDIVPGVKEYRHNKEGDTLTLVYANSINAVVKLITVEKRRYTTYSVLKRKGTGDTLLVKKDTTSEILTLVKNSKDTVIVEKKIKTNGQPSPVNPSQGLGAMGIVDFAPLQGAASGTVALPESLGVWGVDSTTFPGTLIFDGTAGALRYTLPFDTNGKTIELKKVQGNIRVISKTGEFHYLPYAIQQNYSGFVPQDSLLNSYWSVPPDSNRFAGGKEHFTLTSESPAANPAFRDTVIVRSNFKLSGDFNFNLRLHRPAKVSEGYTIMVFLASVAAPRFTYVPFGDLGWIMDFDAAGIKAKISESAPWIETFGFGTNSSRGSTGLSFETVLEFKRREKAITFSHRKINQTAFETIQTWPHKKDNVPDNLYLYIVLGSVQESGTVDLECWDFRINEGKITLP